jgi:hypothetical protein
MVKFWLPDGWRNGPTQKRVTAAVTMAGNDRPPTVPCVHLVKFLVKFRRFKFDENSHCILVDFGPNARNIANDSFRPVCYISFRRR